MTAGYRMLRYIETESAERCAKGESDAFSLRLLLANGVQFTCDPHPYKSSAFLVADAHKPGTFEPDGEILIDFGSIVAMTPIWH